MPEKSLIAIWFGFVFHYREYSALLYRALEIASPPPAMEPETREEAITSPPPAMEPETREEAVASPPPVMEPKSRAEAEKLLTYIRLYKGAFDQETSRKLVQNLPHVLQSIKYLRVQVGAATQASVQNLERETNIH
jgi:hypothetical protein